jgi:hypothetical protein
MNVKAEKSGAAAFRKAPLPKRGRIFLCAFGNTRAGIGRTVIRKTETVNAQILSPGQRIQVRAGVKPNVLETHA